MIQLLRNAFEVSRHHLKGVYICKISKSRKSSSAGVAPPVELVCTLHDGKGLLDYSGLEGEPKGTEYGPIQFTYMDRCSSLRPWSPDACVLSAAIHNRLIHFPVRPGSRVFALDCSFRTLSHIADIVGPSGRLIGVISRSHPQRPKPAEVNRFTKMHPRVSIINEDVQNASLDRYKRLLSLPEASKQAFLMALHPRLGKDSPVRKLGDLGEETSNVVKKIFDYLECSDAADMSCLIVCHWPQDTRVDVMREVVLSHIDILQRLRGNKKAKQPRESGGEEEQDDDSDKGECDKGEGGADKGFSSHSEDDSGEAIDRKKRKSKSKKNDPAPQWILLDVPTDRIVTNNPAADINAKLTEVVNGMKKYRSGLRTGLFAKEQLMLMPHFPNHTLLVLKYTAQRDECTRKLNRRNLPLPPGLDTGNSEADCSDARSQTRPPSASQMPMPAFSSFGKPPAGLEGVGSMPTMSAPPGKSTESGSASSSSKPARESRESRASAAAAPDWLAANGGVGSPCGQRASAPPGSAACGSQQAQGRKPSPQERAAASGKGVAPGLGGSGGGAGSDYEYYMQQKGGHPMHDPSYGRDPGGKDGWDNVRWAAGDPAYLSLPSAHLGKGAPPGGLNSIAPGTWRGGDPAFPDSGPPGMPPPPGIGAPQRWKGQGPAGRIPASAKGAAKGAMPRQQWPPEGPPDPHWGYLGAPGGKPGLPSGTLPLQPGFVQNQLADQQYWG